VLVSQNTYQLTSAQFTWQSLGEIAVKGVSQLLAVHRPLTHIDDAKNVPEEQALPSFFLHIGREIEFHALRKSVDGLFDGRGHIAFLTGEVGTGKGFLLKEIQQYFEHRETLLEESHLDSAAALPSLRWVSGRCRSYSQAWPYSMWLDLFRNWLGLRPDASKEERRTHLRHHAEEIWGETFEEHYPYLATFLGLPVEETYNERIRHLDAEGLRQRYFLAVRSWIETATRAGAVVLVFSDMHWADDSSLALLRFCLPICDTETMLWLLSYRLERNTSIWEFHHFIENDFPHRSTRVDLPPLTEPQSTHLIEHLIGKDTLPSQTRSLIVSSAGGNPHYILELIRSLIANGILVREPENGAWQATRTVTTLDLPTSVQRLLLARIDRLAGHERLVLQIASVIGSVFWFDILQSLLTNHSTLKADLASLQRNQYIQETGRSPELGMQYVFKSPLVRDATYESLLSVQRTAYHLRAAEFIENRTDPDTLEGYDAMLAYHYGQAGNHRKELFYTILAAEQARKIYANAEAHQHFNRAIELLDLVEADPAAKDLARSIQAQRFEVLRGRRAVHLDLGDMDAARADTQALLALAQQMPEDRIWLIDALLASAEFPANNREELRPDLHMAEQALDLSRELGDTKRELASLMSVARIRLALREANALGIAEEALGLARHLSDLSSEVNILLRIGHAYGMDNLSRSREYLEAALAKSKSLNDKRIEALLLETLGRQFERDGDYHRQLTQYEQKRLALAREIGNRYVEGNALMSCGQIEGPYLGDYEAALLHEKEALKTWEHLTGRIFPLLRIAQILTAQGHYEEAMTVLETARPLGDKVVMDIGRAGLGLVNIILFNALGDEAHLWQALDLVHQTHQMTSYNLVSQQYRMAAACEASDTHLKLANLYAESDQNECQKHLAWALESSQSALDLYEHFGFVQIVECTSEEILHRHSQALAANNRADEATEFLERAYKEMMRKYDLIPEDSPFRKTYLENISLHKDILAAYAPRVKPGKSKRKSKSAPSK
jgi:tetratricopeptide (TPR) repeat protein